MVVIVSVGSFEGALRLPAAVAQQGSAAVDGVGGNFAQGLAKRRARPRGADPVASSQASDTSAAASGLGFFLDEFDGFHDCALNNAGPGCSAFDFNNDGPIDLLDYGAFQDNYLGRRGERCDSAIVVDSLPFSVIGSTAPFNDDFDETCDLNTPGSPDVVYVYQPLVDIEIAISTCTNSAYDTKVYVYADACGSFQSGTAVACNDDSCSTPSFPDPFVAEIPRVPLTAGTTYYIVVDGFNGDAGDYTLDIDEFQVSPTCSPTSGECFAIHTTPGCNDTQCCADVCAQDSICCDPLQAGWDSICVDEAKSLCGFFCGPGNGDCFADNGTPGCDDAACCSSVCAGDSFCCNINDSWDPLCGDQAILNRDCNPSPPPLPQCPVGSAFASPASSPLDTWGDTGFSDAGWVLGNEIHYESFSGINGTISEVNWWGLNTIGTDVAVPPSPPDLVFTPCAKSPDNYEIKFYANAFGEPGVEQCSFLVTPTKVDTGLTYSGNTLYSYSATLPAGCTISDGWISIQGTANPDGCSFLWMSSSNVGAGQHILDDPGGRFPSDYDLSMCFQTLP